MIEIDFSYFTTIPHDKLIILIKQRVVDGSMLRLIKQSRTAEVAYQGKMEPTTVGVMSAIFYRQVAYVTDGTEG